MILLKTACFGLWFTMILALTWAKRLKPDSFSLVSLYLDNPEKAEQQIYSTLGQLIAGERLSLEISEHNPARSELCFIASRISQKYPSVMVQVLDGMENTPYLKQETFAKIL